MHLRSKHPEAAVTLDFDTEYNPEDESDDEEVETEEIFVRHPKGGKPVVYGQCYKERYGHFYGTIVSVYILFHYPSNLNVCAYFNIKGI